jgi:hypothetical protein
MSTNWNFGGLTGDLKGTRGGEPISIPANLIKIYKIEIDNDGTKAICFFEYTEPPDSLYPEYSGLTLYYSMYNTKFIENPTTTDSWTIFSYRTIKIISTTSWTNSLDDYFYVYYCLEDYSNNFIYYYEITADNTVLEKDITLQNYYYYKGLSIRNDGKYLGIISREKTFTLFSDNYILSGSGLTVASTIDAPLINARYISISNNNYTSLILITSDEKLVFIYNFIGTAYTQKNLVESESTGYSLLSNLSYISILDFSFYSIRNSDSNLYKFRISVSKNNEVYTWTNTTITKITDVGQNNEWSCLKSNSINTSTTTNSIFTSLTNIYTYNNSTYYTDDIPVPSPNFVYCALSGLNGSTPYMVSAVNNTNTIFYSTVGGACFIEKTKITIFENCEETQKNIEYLKKGDLVKISLGNYKK